MGTFIYKYYINIWQTFGKGIEMPLKPEDALESIVKKQVKVVFTSGEEYTGKLKTHDEYMNVTLEQGREEIVIKGSKIRLIAFEP
jgi:small nuclear ribonucleoprotein (snRNP)-like protein